MLKWYEEKGNCNDVVLSTKIRLSRNLKKYPFSTKISDDDAKQMVEEVTKVCTEDNILSGNILSCNIQDMNEVNKNALVERSILSLVMANKEQYSGLLMREDESAEIMINENDHLRIQAISSGMSIQDTYKRANLIDDGISDKMEIAFDEKYGYLTTCPTNVGTGLRVSFLLFLPALSAAGKINTLASEISKYGVTLRNIYGEESQNQSDFYQIMNQKTLGCSEQEIMENLSTLVAQIVKQERVRREYVLARNYSTIEDQIYRSYGILKYTKQIDCKDALTLLSQIMLGVDTGIIKLQDDGNLYKMVLNVQPNVLQAKHGKNVGTMTRERLRAEYINKNLPELKTD